MLVFSILTCFSINNSYADDKFSAADFLAWPDKSRSSYVLSALMMANMIAVENDKKQSDCIGDWYFTNRDEKDDYIDGVMEKYPDHHPIGILMAVVEKQCGSFKYR